jgi:hypothetical protein
MRHALARVALGLQAAVATPVNLSSQAAEARRLVEGSLQSTWSPSIREGVGGGAA